MLSFESELFTREIKRKYFITNGAFACHKIVNAFLDYAFFLAFIFCFFSLLLAANIVTGKLKHLALHNCIVKSHHSYMQEYTKDKAI